MNPGNETASGPTEAADTTGDYKPNFTRLRAIAQGVAMSTAAVVEIVLPVAALAAEINAEHERAFGKAREALEHARRAGELLIQAKMQQAHGEWSGWLRANIKCSERTAQSYMQIARAWPVLEAKSATVADLTLRGTLQQLRRDATITKREERMRGIVAPSRLSAQALPRGARKYRTLRHPKNRQWALQALPCSALPYTETVYFAPFDDDTDADLLTRDKDSLVDYFLEHITSLPIEDVDVNGNVMDFEKAQPWAFSLPARGWARTGNECGPILEAAP